jgi:WD40 repeat protein
MGPSSEDPTRPGPTPAGDDVPTTPRAPDESPADRAAKPAGAGHEGRAADFIPGYRIVGDAPIGRGGMGVVWKAIQESTKRPVALKVLNAALFGSDNALQRFRREVELTAKLDHPHIARVYDSGLHEGIGYYAMELIDGQNLEQFVTSRGLSQPRILELVEAICRAVQYAHQKGIIHRDLKPSNILVGNDGAPHVLDFGLAKALEEDDPLTMESDAAGTPAYMSPEQAGGEFRSLGTPSDVYTLGVILFRLLTGQYPHDVTGSALGIMKRIAEQPARRFREVSRKSDPELDVVLAKALRREPQDRYASAAHFADDLRRYLNREPLIAQPPTVPYLLKRLVSRYRVPMATAAGVCLLLLAMATWAYVRVRNEKNVSVAAQKLERQERQEADAQRRQALSQKELANLNARRATEEKNAATLSAADALFSAGRPLEALGLYEGAWDSLGRLGASQLPAELGAWDIHRANAIPVFSSPAVFPGSPNATIPLSPGLTGALALPISPDGTIVLCSFQNSPLRVFDLALNRFVRDFSGPPIAFPTALAVSADSRLALSAARDNVLRLWDIASGAEIGQLRGHQKPADALAISRDGRMALSSSGDGQVRLWDLQAKTLRTTISLPKPIGIGSPVAFSPDARSAIIASWQPRQESISLWDLQTGQKRRTLLPGIDVVTAIDVSPDGHLVVAGCVDGALKLCDVSSGQVRALPGHTGQAVSAAFSPDGQRILSGGQDRQVRLFDVATGTERQNFQSHGSTITRVAFCGGGAAFSFDVENTIKLWKLAEAPEFRVIWNREINHVSFAIGHDGRVALVSSDAHSMSLLDLATNHVLREFSCSPAYLDNVALAQNEGVALAGCSDGSLFSWDVATGTKTSVLPGVAGSDSQANTEWDWTFSADGQFAIRTPRITSPAKPIDLPAAGAWEVATRHELPPLPREATKVLALCSQSALALIGDEVGAASDDRAEWRVWDVANGRQVAALHRPTGSLLCGCFLPDGKRLLTGDRGGNITLWEPASGKAVRSFGGQDGPVTSVAFGSNRTTAFSFADNQAIVAWDLDTGRRLRAFAGPNGIPWKMVASPSSLMLLATRGMFARDVEIWDFSRFTSYRSLENTLNDARSIRAGQHDDPATSNAVGEWCALRGMPLLAVAALEKARHGGIAISPLKLGRCYWEASDARTKLAGETRLNYLESADREFLAARSVAQDQADRRYLALCHDAIRQAADSFRAQLNLKP